MRSQSRRLWLAVLLIAIGAIAATLTGPASATPEKNSGSDLPIACSNHSVTASEFRPFSQKVWDQDNWQRGMPPVETLTAQRKKLECAASPSHLKAMKKEWSKDKTTYFQARSHGLWRAKYKSFEYPDGSRWAVPYPIAWCESGGDYFVGPSGAYGLIPPFEQYMSPKQQDEVAYRLFLEQGEGPWAPYEGGCAYR